MRPTEQDFITADETPSTTALEAASPAIDRAGLGMLAVLVAVVAVTISTVVPLAAAARFLGFTLLCALPGVLLARRLYRLGTGRWLFAVLTGPVWGYSLTSVLFLALWAGGVRRPLWFVVAAVALSLVCALAPPLRGRIRVPSLGRRDVVAVCLVLLLVPLVVGRPYARVAEVSEEGEAWRAYFTADFVWALAVVAEVAKGDVPPHNPYRLGSPLHYYWLAHLIPSIEHRFTAPSTSIREILLANAVLSGLAFLGFLYVFVRHFVHNPAAAAAACTAAVLFHSFEGTERLWVLWRDGAPLRDVTTLNIDAVTRWFYQSMPVDGLQRALLYQPQHQLGYVLGASALLVLIQVRDVLRVGPMLLVGVLFGLGLLLSTFSAAMLVTVGGLFQGVRVIRDRAIRGALVGAAVAAAPMLAAFVLARLFDYVETTDVSLVDMRNRTAWRNWTITVPLSFGAMLIGALVGAGWVAWRRAPGFALLAMWIVVCWVYYFFVNVRDHQNVYVGWRAGHLLFIAFAPFVGFALQEAWAASPRVRRITAAGAAVLALLAAPTVAIDLYNTQDTSNRGEAPGFRWTLIVTPDELEALAWIRQRTPQSAIVQVDPEVRDPQTWAYIPGFAERRMAAGLPLSMIPLREYEAATSRVMEVFRAESADEASRIATEIGIEYLVIGPPERDRHPGLETRLDARPDLWPLAFRNGSMRIYAVARRF
jgi:hypothetical protein